jgi:hypothetical protein
MANTGDNRANTNDMEEQEIIYNVIAPITEQARIIDNDYYNNKQHEKYQNKSYY